jgi:diadenosine tetraphosphate (Ap4A) HIT family hydrolase
MEGELVSKFGIKICELETSKVYLFKEQSHPGRCIVAHKKHVGDMNDLTAEERAAYFAIQDTIFISIFAQSIRMNMNGAVFSL